MTITAGTHFRSHAGTHFTIASITHIHPSGLVDFICYADTDTTRTSPIASSTSDIVEFMRYRVCLIGSEITILDEFPFSQFAAAAHLADSKHTETLLTVSVWDLVTERYVYTGKETK